MEKVYVPLHCIFTAAAAMEAADDELKSVPFSCWRRKSLYISAGSSVMETILSLTASTPPCGQGREFGLEKGNHPFGEMEPKGCDLQRDTEGCEQRA